MRSKAGELAERSLNLSHADQIQITDKRLELQSRTDLHPHGDDEVLQAQEEERLSVHLVVLQLLGRLAKVVLKKEIVHVLARPGRFWLADEMLWNLAATCR